MPLFLSVLSLIRAVDDDGTEALLTFLVTFLAKIVVLNPIVIIQEKLPFLFIFLTQPRACYLLQSFYQSINLSLIARRECKM